MSIMARLAASAAATGAAVVARRGAEAAWRRTRDREPPRASQVADDRDLRDLLLWLAVLGGSVLVARRVAASGAKRLLGDDDED